MADHRNDGGPAFPIGASASTSGMRLRDWFAGQALQAFMRVSYSSGGGYTQYETHAKDAARAAYALANAMIEERSK